MPLFADVERSIGIADVVAEEDAEDAERIIGMAALALCGGGGGGGGECWRSTGVGVGAGAEASSLLEEVSSGVVVGVGVGSLRAGFETAAAVVVVLGWAGPAGRGRTRALGANLFLDLSVEWGVRVRVRE